MITRKNVRGAKGGVETLYAVLAETPSEDGTFAVVASVWNVAGTPLNFPNAVPADSELCVGGWRYDPSSKSFVAPDESNQ